MHERYNSAHESDAEKVSSIDLLPGELHHYPDDGGVEKIIRKSGTKVTMDEVLSFFDSNPTARDASNGTICVQARDSETGNAHHYYTDGRVVLDSRQPNIIGVVDLSAPPESSSIVVGESWDTPFGATGLVDVIALPYARAYLEHDQVVDRTGKASALQAGAGMMSDIVNRLRHRPQVG